MSESQISAVTINALQQPFSFEGDFLLLSAKELIPLFSNNYSFKTKFYVLLIVNQGSGVLVVDNVEHEIAPEKVFFVNYNQIFRFENIIDFAGEAVLFTRSFYNLIYTGNRKIKDDTAFSGLSTSVYFTKNDFEDFFLSITDLKKEFGQVTVLSKEILCLLLKVLMLKYIRKTENVENINLKTSRKSAYIEDFKNLVHTHFKELKRTSEYSKFMNISANYLNALVKEKLDISAENLIQNRVILEAERLLLNTDLSVTEISYELGFSDKSHFGKYFKKVTLESPNNFRKKSQQANLTQ